MYIETMITSEKYIILDSISEDIPDSAELCILNFNILSFQKELTDIITANKNVVFWAVTEDFSKEYVKIAGRTGIKNLVHFPVKQELIDKFFKNKSENFTDFKNYEKLNDSKILIVDDNEMNIMLLEEILADLGVLIKSCQNPCYALELIKKEKYDLCLLDILMPEMSGFDVAEYIKNSPLNKNTPIIFISAISDTENKMNGYNLGACSYISKPFIPKLIKGQIYNLLKSEEIKKATEKEKENFVATLTHDLKSPINAEILALDYLIKNHQINNNEMLSELLNSAKYLKHITDKILCHYKQDSKTLTLNKEQTNFCKLVIDCIEEMKYLTAEKNLQIRLKNDCCDDSAYIDIIEIKRVINNLISNAIEFSYQNSFIDIEIRDNSDKIYFKITDYGVGVDLSKYNRIFDEYMTLSKEQKKIGFGLGLKICKTIIEAHNGEIKIDSIPNKETTVSFYIPKGVNVC